MPLMWLACPRLAGPGESCAAFLRFMAKLRDRQITKRSRHSSAIPLANERSSLLLPGTTPNGSKLTGSRLTPRKVLEQAVEQANALQPDLILLGADYYYPDSE